MLGNGRGVSVKFGDMAKGEVLHVASASKKKKGAYNVSDVSARGSQKKKNQRKDKKRGVRFRYREQGEAAFWAADTDSKIRKAGWKGFWAKERGAREKIQQGWGEQSARLETSWGGASSRGTEA